MQLQKPCLKSRKLNYLKKEFALIILNTNSENFVIYIVVLDIKRTNIAIYPF